MYICIRNKNNDIMETLANGFEDLYGDSLTSVIELKTNPTFETIKSYFTELDEMERTFNFNGKTIIAKRKFTFKGMKSSGKMFQVKTNYLHVWIQVGKSKDTLVHYKETREGSFVTV